MEWIDIYEREPEINAYVLVLTFQDHVCMAVYKGKSFMGNCPVFNFEQPCCKCKHEDVVKWAEINIPETPDEMRNISLDQ